MAKVKYKNSNNEWKQLTVADLGFSGVKNKAPTLSWGDSSTIGTVDGVSLTATLPELSDGIYTLHDSGLTGSGIDSTKWVSLGESSKTCNFFLVFLRDKISSTVGKSQILYFPVTYGGEYGYQYINWLPTNNQDWPYQITLGTIFLKRAADNSVSIMISSDEHYLNFKRESLDSPVGSGPNSPAATVISQVFGW